MSSSENVSTLTNDITLRCEFAFREDTIEAIFNIKEIIKREIQQVCEKYNYYIESLKIEGCRVILDVKISEFVTPVDIVRNIKSYTLVGIMKECPSIKRLYGKKGTLWTAEYIVKSVN